MTKAQEIKYDRVYHAENDRDYHKVCGLLREEMSKHFHFPISGFENDHSLFFLDADRRQVVKGTHATRTIELSDRVENAWETLIKIIVIKE